MAVTGWCSDGAVGCQEIFAEATKRKLFSSELVNDSRLDDFMDSLFRESVQLACSFLSQ